MRQITRLRWQRHWIDAPDVGIADDICCNAVGAIFDPTQNTRSFAGALCWSRVSKLLGMNVICVLPLASAVAEWQPVVSVVKSRCSHGDGTHGDERQSLITVVDRFRRVRGAVASPSGCVREDLASWAIDPASRPVHRHPCTGQPDAVVSNFQDGRIRVTNSPRRVRSG